ncbi:dihydroxyacetone kinase, C-terminal domain [Streptoalloteichus tenebrarius]|uniref:Dihydroxyacetone kinase, C-terminal domain n=1 Tax=Streptoalloteichus tenebrarius (strain ATCC 17920 / DSM 40477 / JCM 4838 / CBS 697.72 / NBRC 16177 / NCIMB 11028 / NRRL B-12390 / A12253. 1 / ISP 5477) TaxID=1933 RepID=A0ABT1HZV9_STRSD|nr:dihydroxyacetone kinase subunit DhaL [Streptoalloteichus tenebrarius]MCP2261039.1 dihydroxyacetone kinase, C-terminal domain [Streptoalloteichus tenebrarius]BFF03168.1 dihydroxyacetone kinase subunit DhaL [Streptoalloteichus tenebrarius]
MTCTAEDLVRALRAVAAAVADHRAELTELDRVIGDADHGENLRRGFLAVVTKVDSADLDTPTAVLKAVGTTLISTVGGASGPLYGTAFLRAANAVTEKSEVDGPAAAEALRAALGGVVARGRAEIGDKTMVDALSPAVDAAVAAAEAGGDVAAVLAAAAEAADRGAESTTPLVARKGRASYLGERSAGHLDPGARSTALILRALASSAGAR